MPLETLLFAVNEKVRGYFVVGVRQRLQRTGSDYALYANTNFEKTDETQSEFLKALLDKIRRNDAGINHVSVEPFQICFTTSGTHTCDEIVSLVESAALDAGMMPEQVNS